MWSRRQPGDRDWKNSPRPAQGRFYMVPKQVRLYPESKGELSILSGEVKSDLLGRTLVGMLRVFWKETEARETGLVAET